MIGIWNSTHSLCALKAARVYISKNLPQTLIMILRKPHRSFNIWHNLGIFLFSPSDLHLSSTLRRYNSERVQKLLFGVTLTPLKCVAGCLCGAQVLLVTVYWCQNIPNTPFFRALRQLQGCGELWRSKTDPLILSANLNSWLHKWSHELKVISVDTRVKTD